MSGWWNGRCDNPRQHEREAERDARYGYRPDPEHRREWEGGGRCDRAYHEAYEAERHRVEREAEERRDEERREREARMERQRQEAEWEREAEERAAEEERREREAQEAGWQVEPAPVTP